MTDVPSSQACGHAPLQSNMTRSNEMRESNSNGASWRSGPQQYDWRTFLTVEERQAVRYKIKQAYSSSCKTYEDLLEATVAIEEELLHISAPSRLDYFKSGFEFENRVNLKKRQLTGQLASESAAAASSTPLPLPPSVSSFPVFPAIASPSNGISLKASAPGVSSSSGDAATASTAVSAPTSSRLSQTRIASANVTSLQATTSSGSSAIATLSSAAATTHPLPPPVSGTIGGSTCTGMEDKISKRARKV